ncbi:class I SAM-dependent methyltransferase [Moheibacter sediminis]|uniref:Methyltransferase domain-containing protein n=1 Tax=Moheibacter sediminis TaxID=1434700 RepID=A0A1W1ZTJ3_9FLAO|nr:class I SAM-dependent methyltransferase [Moheibacter sediminis]SMC51686.1 Methyltransferase domain-containing protein [Moheibacter sediminis]
MNEQELKGLAEQLGNPSGKKGVEVAEMMDRNNIKMTIHSIDNLEIKNGDSILEIGHGNCGHLKLIFEKAIEIQYTGYDISELMNIEAKKLNQNLIQNNSIEFKLYDGDIFSEADNSFDKIFTVNTLYFWSNPIEFINEIYRTTKPNGIFCLTFAEKDFMEKLPFTKFGFNLYSIEDVQKLIEHSNFNLEKIENQTEEIQSKSGEIVSRKFLTMVLKKTL